VKILTGRPIHLFFRLEEMMKFAQKTEKQIIIWDEPALDSLSTDQLNTLNRDMLRLFMTIRKKQHFFIINFTKFWKFPEYMIVDRALGMIHVYSRREMEIGRYLYIPKRNLERLWNDYRKQKKRNYKAFTLFHGTFPEVMEEYFECFDISIGNKDHCTLKDYEEQKDIGINSIGDNKSKMSKKELALWKKINGLRLRVALAKGEIREKFAQSLGINRTRLIEWSQIPIEDTDLVGKPRFELLRTAKLIV
jgi:hypothetical protein